MRCEEALELLSARLDGELTAQEEQELEDHLSACPACRGLAEELSALHLSFEDLEDTPAPEDFAGRVMERVRELERKKKVLPLFRRPQVRALAGLAACAVVCAGLYAASRAQDAGWNGVAENFQPAAQCESAPENGERSAVTEAESKDLPKESLTTGAAAGGPGQDLAMDAAGDEMEPDMAPYVYTAMSSPRAGVEARSSTRSESVKEAPSVLTLSGLPEGWEEVLGPDTPCSPGPEGGLSTRYHVSSEQWHALAALAEEQGLLLSQAEGDGPDWAVDVTP